MRYILVLIFFATIHNNSKACEVCGGGAGAINLSMQPDLEKNFAGIRYRNSAFNSHLNAGERFRTQENFNTFEFWGRYFINKNWNIVASLPFSIHSQTQLISNEKTNLSGIGDAAFLVAYKFDNKMIDDRNAPKHTFLIGSGLKLPTGHYKYNEESLQDVANPNFQLGTGSVDMLFNLNYLLEVQDFGFATDLQLRYNFPNIRDYKFGDRAIVNSMIYWRFENQLFSFAPNIGAMLEAFNADVHKSEKISVTGGHILNLTVGTNIMFDNYALGVFYFYPLDQKIGDNDLISLDRLMLNLSLLF